MRTLTLGLAAATALAGLTSVTPAAPAAATAAPRHCARADAVRVPGAVEQKTACLDDLTTAGTSVTGHTNVSDWAGLNATGTRNPTGVPGVQVDGYFPDSSTTNTNNGWNHDSQFVIRFPDRWNGGLVVTGAPGTRRQYANDFVIADHVLARGFAFAATDKGNNGTSFYDDGSKPGGSVREWNRRVTQLTYAAKAAVRQKYGRAARRTYMAGISNGGYLTRWQLENHPRLFDGGLDWEGTLFRAAGPNLFTYLPTALRDYPAWRAGDEQAGRRMVRAGFEPGSEFLWDYHYAYYWDLTQRLYREEFDPGYDGDLDAGVPFCRPGTPSCDADYRYAARPRRVHDAVRSVQLTGRDPEATAHGVRRPRHAAAAGHRHAGLRPAGAPDGERPAAPQLRGARGQPRRRALRHLPRPAPAAAAVRDERLRPAHRLGGAGPRTFAEPRRPATGERRPARGVRPAPVSGVTLATARDKNR